MKPTSLAAEEGRAGTLNALRRRLAIGAGAATLLAIAAGMAHAQIPDHLKCYQIKDISGVLGTALRGTVDLDTPQFGADPGCKISKAKLFCVPASKTNVSVIDKVTDLPITPLPISGPEPGDRICYKVKCLATVPNQVATDQFGLRLLGKFKASFVCTPAFKGTVRFVDNGDGTVTDHYTGLQWEQKTTAVGSGVNLADPHDVDNTYKWSASGTDPDGTAFTDFLGELNDCVDDGTYPPTGVTGGFADHCDWRLPTIVELQTILLAPYACGTSPCIDPNFGPTAASNYWSSTTNAFNPLIAWFVNFFNGYVGYDYKFNTFYVRAVRGGS